MTYARKEVPGKKTFYTDPKLLGKGEREERERNCVP